MSSDDPTLPASTPAAQDFSLLSSAMTTVAALVFVLVLAVFALRWLQRRYVARSTGSAPEVISTVVIGPKERVVCLRHRGREYLLAVGAASISVVDQWTDVESQPHPSETKMQHE